MLAFLAGVCIASVLMNHFLIFAVLVFIIACLIAYIQNDKIFLFFACCFLIGFFCFKNSFPVFTNADISYFNGQKSVFYGTVCKEVDIRKDEIKLTICAVEKKGKKIDGLVLISMPRYPEYEYGDFLEIEGDLIRPEKIEDFDYDKYLARYNIYSVMYQPYLKLLQHNEESLFYAHIFSLKKKVETILNKIFPEPYASFEAGLLLGSRKGIPDNLMAKFNITGLTHIIAISGYNITLIISMISGFLVFLPKKQQIIISITVITIFVIFVGASSAVVRAGIMGIIALSAIWFSRKSFISITLVFTAFVMSLFNPKILVYDVGFQLSFLATVGLIYVSPLIGKYLNFPNFFGIRESFLLTMSAQIAAVPIILLNFERLSLVSPLANVLIAPFVPLAMMFGAIAFLVAVVSLSLGKIFALPAILALKIIIFFTEICAKLPYASVDVKWFKGVLVVLYYCFLMWFVFLRNNKNLPVEP